MKRFSLSALILVLISGCSQGSDLSATNRCSYDQELPSVVAAWESGSIFLFGERHGTVEAPTFVAEFACRVANETQAPLIVLLELPMPKVLANTAGDTLPASQAKELILAEGNAYWTRAHDGRTSVAMMDAIEQLLQLKEQGSNIAFGSLYPDENIRSKYDEMGLSFADDATHVNRFFQESLQILKYKDAFKNVIVLSGDNHTRNHLRFFEKMELDVTYLGFLQQSGGGTEWNCQPNSGGCKAHPTPTPRQSLINSSENASLVMLNEDGLMFDGAFVFKTTTASYPYFSQDIDE